MNTSPVGYVVRSAWCVRDGVEGMSFGDVRAGVERRAVEMEEKE